MLFHNIDHVKESTIEGVSREASASFFAGSARLLDMLAHIEKLEYPQAAAYGRVCVAEFSRTQQLFRDVSSRVEKLKWLRDEVSRVDQKLAAFDAGISYDMPELNETKAQMIRGDFHEVFKTCADEIASFSADLDSVIDSVKRLQDEPERLDLRPVHQLLVKWRLLTTKGQQTSAAIALAMTVPA